ncbi:MAG: hypothetical protein ACXACY_20415 [Candidatus Hodarchaeales archaeon]
MIGISEPLQILDENGNKMIEFGPIWIDIGIHISEHRGNGFEHIIQQHLDDFMRIRSDLKSPKDVYSFLFNAIQMQKGVIVKETSNSYEIAYRLLDEDGNIIFDDEGFPRFFSIILWKSEFNKIHTGYPYYIENNPNLNNIFNNLRI